MDDIAWYRRERPHATRKTVVERQPQRIDAQRRGNELLVAVCDARDEVGVEPRARQRREQLARVRLHAAAVAPQRQCVQDDSSSVVRTTARNSHRKVSLGEISSHVDTADAAIAPMKLAVTPSASA